MEEQHGRDLTKFVTTLRLRIIDLIFFTFRYNCSKFFFLWFYSRLKSLENVLVSLLEQVHDLLYTREMPEFPVFRSLRC